MESLIPLQKLIPSCHPAMDLVFEPFHNMWYLQVLLIFTHSFLILILGWKYSNWDYDLWRIVRVDHSRVAGSRNLERCTFPANQIHNLAAPTIPNNSPCLDLGMLLLDCFDKLVHARHSF